MGMHPSAHIWYGYVLENDERQSILDEFGDESDNELDYCITNYFIGEETSEYFLTDTQRARLEERNPTGIETTPVGHHGYGCERTAFGWSMDSWGWGPHRMSPLEVASEWTRQNIANDLKNIIELAGWPRPEKDPEIVGFCSYG